MATRFALAPFGALLLLAACASTQVDSRWADQQFSGTSLRGSRVLVACDSYDLGLKAACEEQLGAELTARGASPVIASPSAAAPSPADLSQQARSANAQAVLSARVGLADVRSGGPAFSVGIGGFGIGGGSTRAGVGVGVAVPVTGVGASGHTSSGGVIEAATGRTMWTFSVTTPRGDIASQMGEMAKAVGNAAQNAGLLPQ